MRANTSGGFQTALAPLRRSRQRAASVRLTALSDAAIPEYGKHILINWKSNLLLWRISKVRQVGKVFASVELVLSVKSCVASHLGVLECIFNLDSHQSTVHGNGKE